MKKRPKCELIPVSEYDGKPLIVTRTTTANITKTQKLAILRYVERPVRSAQRLQYLLEFSDTRNITELKDSVRNMQPLPVPESYQLFQT